jgi:PAS domain S-box-containing protein
MLAAYLSGFGPGLLVSALSVLASWRYFMAPSGSFQMRSDGDIIVLFLFGVMLVLECVIVKMLHDATERERLTGEQAILFAQQSRENGRILDATFDAVPAAIIVADRSGKLVRMNAATRRIWGEAPHSNSVDAYVEWKGWWADGSARHGQPIKPHEWGLAAAIKGESRTEMVEVEPFGHPGERILTLLSAAPIRDEATGEVSGGVVAQVDITETFKAQRALQESEAKFRMLADNIPQLAWMTDPDGSATWFNSRWFDYTGAKPEDMVRFGWKEVHHPDYIRAATEKFVQHMKSGDAWEDTFPLRGRDGDYRWFLSRAVPIKDDRGKIVHWFGTNTDVTEQRNAEEALRVADRRKDEFLAMLAHELRNPLAPIVAAVDLLSFGDSPGIERVRLITEVLGRQARHLASLVDDLLDVSRVRRGLISLDRTPLIAQTVVTEAVEQARPCINANAHTFTCTITRDKAWVNADRKRLVQVFANLLNNAAKYTPKGGHIEVFLEATESEVLFAVQDNGIGMRPELLSVAFDLFAQGERGADRSQGGLGIGLALVKNLVEMHDGTVAAKSAGPGLGSRFEVKLPRVAPRACSDALGDETVATAHRRLHVLLVDDNVDAASTLAMCLEQAGHEVTVCHAPTQALERAAQRKPDACLLDIGLPEMDGFALARRLREVSGMHDVLMAAVSGYSDPQSKRKARDAGFDHYFTKPVQTQDIIDMLAAYSEQMTQSSTPIASPDGTIPGPDRPAVS